MAHAATFPTEPELAHHVTPAGSTPMQHPPVSPGKVAMWLFLATEVMFFTAIIGSYIVLRAGSPFGSYSHDYPPGTELATVRNLSQEKLFQWPKPYDYKVNPLSIDWTAANTFILICSSVTMVLALSAIQRGDRRKCSLFLLATVLIGSVFLGVQVVEYYQLMIGHHYPIGVSRTGHFTPDVGLFASCFFTMTGFHGAHVAAGVVMLACICVQSFRGVYTRHDHSSIELVGLYWHFVDLVWILLFTVVYLI